MKPKTLKKKEYCVHIYPCYYEEEGIMATSPEEAEMIALNNGDFEEIDHTEVMRVHNCYPNTDDAMSQDNDLTNTHCENCGKKL